MNKASNVKWIGMFYGMSIWLVILALADVLFMQAGIDGIGVYKKIKVKVVSIDEVPIARRVTKSGNQSAIMSVEPGLRLTYEYTNDGEVSRSSRYFLFGRELEIPKSIAKESEKLSRLRVGDEIPAYFVKRNGAVFIEIGLYNAMKFWLRAWLGFMLFMLAAMGLFFVAQQSRISARQQK